MEVEYDTSTKSYYFQCPHCREFCEVRKEDIRCTIFRHAVFKKDMRFVPPHAPKEVCEGWLRDGVVYGCAKPFKFDGKKVDICDYI